MNDFPQTRQQCCAMRGIQAGTFTLRFVRADYHKAPIPDQNQKHPAICWNMLEQVFVLFYNLESQFFRLRTWIELSQAQHDSHAELQTEKLYVVCGSFFSFIFSFVGFFSGWRRIHSFQLCNPRWQTCLGRSCSQQIRPKGS